MRLANLAVFALVVAGTTSAQESAKGDWPQWRGPKRDGVSTDKGLLKEWPKEGPTLLWKATGAGRGYATVAVTGGKIYTMGDGPSTAGDSDEYVLAFEEATGKQLWKAKVGPAYNKYESQHEDWDSSRSTPTIDGGSLYALSAFGDLVCLESATGKEVWRKNLEKDFGGKVMSGWGYSESPLVEGENLLVTPGGSKGTVAALNKKTGALVWQSSGLTDPAAYASLVPAEIGGVPQVLVLTSKSVAGIATKDGKVLWQADRPGKTAVIPTPIYKEGLLFVTSSYGVGCNAFKITADGGSFKAEEIYANKDMSNHHGGVILVGDYLYGTSDALKCLELKTGKLVWKDNSVGKGSVAYADGLLVVRSERGPVALVEATPDGYKEKGRFTPPDRTKRPAWSHPVITGQKLYLRDGDVLLSYDLRAK
jgi:outer membrane protein assembly factor BamB